MRIPRISGSPASAAAKSTCGAASVAESSGSCPAIAAVSSAASSTSSASGPSESSVSASGTAIRRRGAQQQNVGSTRRQGIEAEVNIKSNTLQLYASYAFVDARFLDALQVGSNSPFAVDGNVQILPGNQIPAIPRHRVKAGFEYSITDAFKVGGDALFVSNQFFVGDDSNQASKLPSYAVFNVHASYQINKTFQIYGRVDNLFDNRYATYGTFFETDAVPNFTNGGAQFTDPRSVSPARPRAIYAGLRATF